jgi:hypothetical protein
MSCPLCKSYTNWKIFFKHGSNVHLNKGMCRTHVAHVSAQGQGNNWRSSIKQWNIRQYCCVSYVSPTLIERFSSILAQMFTSTRECAELMLPMCQLKVKVKIEGQISNNKILDSMSCPLCKSYTNWKIFFNLGSNVHFNKVKCRTHVTLV